MCFFKKNNAWNINFFENNKISTKKIFILACFFYENNYLLNLYYAREICKTGYTLILVADNDNVPMNICNEFSKYCYCICFKKHHKYDFGSYLQGYEIIKKKFDLNSITDLILSNDSVIGPLAPLNNIISKMNTKKTDFWGLSSNIEFGFHIQSYFLHFNSCIIKTNTLYNFLKQVKRQKNYLTIVKKYEVLLTSYLISKGYRFSAYLPYNLSFSSKYSDNTIFGIELITLYYFPFIKRKCFTEFSKIKNEKNKILNYLYKNNNEIFNLIKMSGIFDE